MPAEPSGPLDPRAEATIAARIEVAQWYDRLTTFVPRAWLGQAAVVANVLVFAWMVMQGVDARDPTSEALVRFGANESSLTLHGEPWRLLTAAFLHAGLIHL